MVWVQRVEALVDGGSCRSGGGGCTCLREGGHAAAPVEEECGCRGSQQEPSGPAHQG